MSAKIEPSEEDDQGGEEARSNGLWSALAEVSGASLVMAAMVGFLASSYSLIWHPHYRRARRRVPWSPRLIPAASDQRDLRDQWLRAVSFVYIGPETRVELSHGRIGHSHRPPRSFYESVGFGLTAWTPNQTHFEDKQQRLEEMLANVSGHIFPWLVHLPDGTQVDGFYVQYSLDELKAPLKLATAQQQAQRALAARDGGRLLPDWHDVQASLERIARAVDQHVLVSFTPNTFAQLHPEDDLRHTHILLTVHPLRTGLQHLRASAAVWAAVPWNDSVSNISWAKVHAKHE